MSWVLANLPTIAGHLLAHLLQAVPAIIASFVLAIPVARLARASRPLRAVLVTGSSLLYAVPSLALGDEIILLREGAHIAQRGSGAELLAAPADDFVARFLGLDDAARQLRLKDVAKTRIVLDRAGRAVGRLSDESVTTNPGSAQSSESVASSA